MVERLKNQIIPAVSKLHIIDFALFIHLHTKNLNKPNESASSLMEEVPLLPSLRFSGHVVAMPYPSRGHVNPMMTLCKLIASSTTPPRGDDNDVLLITFVVTQEWLGFIGSEPKPHNIRFATIPNDVVPLDSHIAADIPGFFQAAVTNMEAPFEKLLDRLEPPVTAIIGDVELKFPVAVGRRRNIQVAVLWTMSASFYLMLHQLEILTRNRRLKFDLLDSDHEEQTPGISSAQLADLRTVLHENDLRFLQLALECISTVPKADYLIVNTIQELEAEAINSLKAMFNFPIYPIAFPYFKPGINHSVANSDHNHEYLNWLDSQPAKSVLHISFGSFLSVSGAQLDEIASALNTSGIRYFWVVRGEASWLKETCGDRGLVVPWCDQLKVLSHPSVGGFWSHCGWNSTLEAVFAGIPMLTFPLFFDQVPNSRQIAEEWKNGWELKRSELGTEELITQEEILEVIRKFMDPESKKGKEIRDRALELKGICDREVAQGGSSYMNLNAFMKDILRVRGHRAARDPVHMGDG